MGLRSSLCVVIVLIALVVGACTSPGTPFAYKDVKVIFGPSASPTQPVVGQDTTLTFTLRNTWNQLLSGAQAVEWELWETGPAPTKIAWGSEDLVAFTSITKTHLITGGPAKGTHTYEVRVDPNGIIAEQDESNNTSSTLTVLVADQDIAFASGASVPVITPGATVNDPPTLTFTLTNTVNLAQATPAPSVSVPYDITVNGVAIAHPYAPGPDPAVVGANTSAAITVSLPATNSAGTFVYTITLSPANGDDSHTTNNTATVTLVYPAGG